MQLLRQVAATVMHGVGAARSLTHTHIRTPHVPCTPVLCAQAFLGDFKLVSQLIAHWNNRMAPTGRSSATGTVLKCLNAIRLQVRPPVMQGPACPFVM